MLSEINQVEISHLREHIKRLETRNRESQDKITELELTVSGLRRSLAGVPRTFDHYFGARDYKAPPVDVL